MNDATKSEFYAAWVFQAVSTLIKIYAEVKEKTYI